MIVAGAVTGTALAQDAPPPESAHAASNLVLFNQIQGLRDQMRQMQGEIEVLQHQLQQSQQSGKDQYVDLDSRISKLEHAQSAPAASAPVASAAAPARPTASSAPPAASAAPPSKADEAASQAAYDAAFKALRAGNYVASAQGFRAFIDKYPSSPLVSNAYYWLGGSYYVTQNYKPALAAFQTLLQKYPSSSKAAESQLRIADCQIGLKDFAAARATLAAVIKAHPGTPIEKRARERMQDLPGAK